MVVGSVGIHNYTRIHDWNGKAGVPDADVCPVGIYDYTGTVYLTEMVRLESLMLTYVLFISMTILVQCTWLKW
jgi:hypothetical protein